MAEHDQYLEVRPGDTLPIDLPIKDSDGNAVPLTDLQGNDIKFVLSRAGAEILTKIIGDGIEVIDAAKGEVTITLDAADTAEFAGLYDWIVVLTATSGQVFSIADGRLFTLGTEAVSLAMAKSYLKVEHDEDDSLIASLIITAREIAEGYTDLSIASRERVLALSVGDLEGYPAKMRGHMHIALPHGPVRSITSIRYYLEDDSEAVMSVDDYRLDSRGRVVLRAGKQWPAGLRWEDSMIITYEAGYATPEEVPGPIREAILRTVATHYENREDEVVGTVVARLSTDAEALLDPYRVVGL